jgi:uncharacterized protein
MEMARIDLEQLDLGSGQAKRFDRVLIPAEPVVGGVAYPIEDGGVDARIDVSRTTSGFAMRLTAQATIAGPCARCLEPARVPLEIDVREVEQGKDSDSELSSPYVEDGMLDAGAWLHDAIRLALPEQVLCRPDCAGLCPECGINLNDPAAEGHRHEAPLDPRFAKLRELQGE